MRYLSILLVAPLLVALAGCSRPAETSELPPSSAIAVTTTTGREAYKEAWNILGLTVRIQQLLAIADTIDSFDYPDVNAVQAGIATEEQALRTLFPPEPSPEYRTVNDAMLAALGDLWAACTYKKRFDGDRQDLQSYVKLRQLTDSALSRIFSTEEEFNALLAGIGHNPVNFPSVPVQRQ